MPQPRILIADDDRLVRVTLSKGLQDAGYIVIEASSGDEALAICQEDVPDLAILDIRMPGLNGIETACKLTEQFNLPFMIFSAYGESELVKDAINQGALGYLVKPLDVMQILPTVETALERAYQINNLKDKEYHLNKALSTGRETSMAVGIIMERHRESSSQAFDSIRKYARSQRKKLAEIATEIVTAAELMNTIKDKESQ